MMKTVVINQYSHKNGISTGNYWLDAKTVDGKITEFDFKVEGNRHSFALLRMFAAEMATFIDMMEKNEIKQRKLRNGK